MTPLLVLHTPGLDADYLRAPLSAIGADAVFVDWRADGDLDGWLDDLERLRARRGHSEWAVLGHGLGGLVAQAYAAAQPERVARLILCSTAPTLAHLGERLERARRALDTQLPGDDGLRALCLEVLPAFFARPAAAPVERFGALAYCKRAFVRALALPGVGAALRQIAAPTMVIHGRYDRVLDLDVCARPLFDAVPGAELVVFEKSGHFPMLEQAAQFVLVVEEFVASRATYAATPLA